MSRDYTAKTESKHAEDRQAKDRLLELIAAKIEAVGLTAKEIQALVPTADRNCVSKIRQLDRSAGSIDRLRGIAAALGLVDRTFIPSAAGNEYIDRAAARATFTAAPRYRKTQSGGCSELSASASDL